MCDRWKPATVLRVSALSTALLMLLFVAGNTMLIAHDFCSEGVKAGEEIWPQAVGDWDLLVVRTACSDEFRPNKMSPAQTRRSRRASSLGETAWLADCDMAEPAVVPAWPAPAFKLPGNVQRNAVSARLAASRSDRTPGSEEGFGQRLNEIVPQTISLPRGLMPASESPGP
jgi:hypothetical protein